MPGAEEFESIIRVNMEQNVSEQADAVAEGLKRIVSAEEYLAEMSGKVAASMGQVDESLATIGSGAAADVGARLANGFEIAVPVVDEFGNVLRTLTLSFDAFGNAVTTGSLAVDGFGRNTLSVAETQQRLAAALAEEEAAMTGLADTLSTFDKEEINAQSGALAVTDAMKKAALATWASEEAFVAIEEIVGRYADTLDVAGNKLRTFADMASGVARDQTAIAESAVKATQAELDLGTATAETVGKFTDLGLAWDKASAGATALADAEDKVAAATKEAADSLTTTADVTSKITLSAEEAATATRNLDEALAGTTLMTREEVDALQVLAEKFIAGTLSLDEFKASQYSEAQILQELVRQLSLGAVSMQELADAGVNLDAVNAVLTNMDAKMSMLAASTKATADGFTLVGDTGLAAGNKTAEGMDTAKTSSAGMNEGFGISQFLLFMLGTMALSAGQQFLSMGMDSEHALNIIQAATGASADQMNAWKTSIEKIGQTYGFTLNEMATGLLTVTRAGFQAADATKVLDNAAQLANATGSQVTDTTDLLTMSLKAYGASASQSATYANALYDAWKSSNLGIQELTSLMGNALPIAAGLGINIGDLGQAVAIFSQSTDNGMIATRDFQAMLSGLQNVADMSSDKLAKLAGSFDLSKYATLDFTAKLAALAAASDGNVATFTRLIGGADNAKIAMDNLNISDQQLATNAANLGVTFNKTTYDSLDAAGKLLYLMTIVGDSGPKFAQLTDGTKATNAALSQLGPVLDAAGQKAADLSSHFDMAKFKSDDLAQKLHDLADFFGGPYSAAFTAAIGGPKNLTEALKIMNTEADKNTVVKVDSKQAQNADTHVSALHQHLIDINSTPAPTAVEQHMNDLQRAVHTTDSDTATATKNMQAAWSGFANAFVTTVGPAITGGLNGITAVLTYFENNEWNKFWNRLGMEAEINLQINLTKVSDYIKGGFKGSTIAALNDWRSAVDQGFRQMVTDTLSSISTWRSQVDQGFRQAVTDAVNTVNNLRLGVDNAFRQMVSSTLATIGGWVNSVIQWFERLLQTVVGGSIVPDMVSRITAAFTAGATAWLAPITTFVTNAENTFNTALAVIPAIATSIGALVNSAFVAAGALWNSTVGAAISTVIATINSYIGAAFSAGAAVGNAIGNGLASAAGWVSQQASNLAGIIASVLPHSPAKEGPLKDLDTFMPGMIDTLVSTMNANKYRLQDASLQLATSISMPVQGLTTQPLTTTVSGNTLSDVVAMQQQQLSALLQLLAAVRNPQQNGQGMQSMPTTGMVTRDQIIKAIYQALNNYGGTTFEFGSRGAFAGLGV